MTAAQKTKRRTRLSPEEREHQIIAAAIEFATERGLNFSTRDLAQHCGVSQSLLYRYFSSKEEIVEKIYEHVYVGRWNPEWDEILIDRNRTVAERLEAYLNDYCRVVLKKDWVRIFLLSSFADPTIAKRYTEMLKRRIFAPILNELLHELKVPRLSSTDAREMALDLIWSFHSSFFYIGVRQWVYKTPTNLEIGALVQCRTKAFLEGIVPFLRESAE